MMERINHARLAADLQALGLTEGATVLVHASLRRIGPVAGGPTTMLAALRDVLGDAATVVVPAHTAGNSITSSAFRAAIAGLSAREAAEFEARIPPSTRNTARPRAWAGLPSASGGSPARCAAGIRRRSSPRSGQPPRS